MRCYFLPIIVLTFLCVGIRPAALADQLKQVEVAPQAGLDIPNEAAQQAVDIPNSGEDVCASYKTLPPDTVVIPDGYDSKLAMMCERIESAKAGNKDAQVITGIYFLNSRNIGHDYKIAAMWFQKAADQGDTGAQWLLGKLYRDGKGVVQDYAVAFKWISQSAAQGNNASQTDLAELYANGQGVEKSIDEAFFWTRLANNRTENITKYQQPMIRPGPEKEKALREKLSQPQIEAVEVRVKAWKPVESEK
jgi:Sel1 repeat